MNTHNARATAEETIGLAHLELQKLEEFSKEKEEDLVTRKFE